MRRVIRLVQQARDARYGLLRGYFHGADDDTSEDRQHERLRSITLPMGSAYGGSRLDDLALEPLGVAVVSLRRANGAVHPAESGLALQGGDTLVLSGMPAALTLAEEKLLGA
jgi:CPA2 family monovalent cation:H+ antiporter-2